MLPGDLKSAKWPVEVGRSVCCQVIPDVAHRVNSDCRHRGFAVYRWRMGKRKKTTDGRNRIVLSPSDDQMRVFEKRAEDAGLKLSTWALSRLWQAVQQDAKR